ncbi:MAG: non-homologous end-joining DNA ligase [Acidimicrobiales bacterium]
MGATSLSPEGRLTVEVEGRRVGLSNLEKVLYPEAGFVKGRVIDYYRRVAPVLLPHLADRPVTVVRHPDGVASPGFFEKQAPAGTPSWVRTARMASGGGTSSRSAVEHVVVDDLPTLVWLANLAAIELHVPMWRLDGRDRPCGPDAAVFDLDPGAPADIVDCCRVALAVRAHLDGQGLELWPKTSGAKGLQCYAPLAGSQPWEEVHSYARSVAETLARAEPELVVSVQRKSARTGRVLVDWSQNHTAKTTVAVYSLRARPSPTVSTPLRWEEVTAVAEGAAPETLRFVAPEALRRVSQEGDLFAPVLAGTSRAPGPGA